MTAYDWKAGDKVVCIGRPICHNGENAPVVGEIYTIREIAISGNALRVTLVEIVNDARNYQTGFHEAMFYTYRFKPVQKRATSIEVFTALLNPTPETVGQFIAADQAKHTKEAAEALAQALYPMARPLW